MRTWILGGLMVVASTGMSLAQDAAAGTAAFSKWCLPCHAAGDGATIKLGPPLNGIDGRKSASFDGFNYSDAFKGLNITWNEAQFKEFINAPMQKVPGTRMAFAGISNTQQRANVIAYLRSLAAEPKPLP